MVGAIVGVKLLTEVLPPHAYGELALAMTAAALSHQIVLGPLSNAFTRFFAPASEAREVRRYLKAVLSLTLGGAAALFALGVLAFGFFEIAGHGRWLALVAATFAFAVVSGCNSVMDSIQNAARHRSVVALHQGLGTWLRFLCAVFLVEKLGVSSTAAMFGYAVGALVTAASQACFFSRGIVSPLSGEQSALSGVSSRWGPRMIDYASPFALFGIFTWLHMASDRWAIQIFGSTAEVGRFAVLYQLGYYPMMLLSGIASQLLAPILFQMAGDATDPLRRGAVSRTNHLVIWASLGFTVFAVLALAMFHTHIFAVLTSRNYLEVSWLLPLMALAGGLFGTGQLAALEMLSNESARNLIRPKIVTAVLGVTLNIAFAALWGVSGVVLAAIVFAGAYFGWVILLNYYSADASR